VLHALVFELASEPFQVARESENQRFRHEPILVHFSRGGYGSGRPRTKTLMR
jgi:hypothetical protein